MANALRAALEDELKRIAEQASGLLTPDAVVAAAKDPANPLHEEFEWDDAVAAHKHRLSQARHLIRSVRIVEREERITLRVWVSDPERSARDQGYIQTMILRTKEDEARRALDAEINRVSSSIARAREIALSLGLIDEVDSLISDAAKRA